MLRPARRESKSDSSTPKLQRTTFETSRAMDFFSEKELVTQTGHEVQEWPLVVVKELLDNALDACEESGINPVIEIVADAGSLSVSDNGPGLPEQTLQSQLDFSIRASSREAYVSPCRGAQGNALKTLLPMPWVIDKDNGKLIVEAHGKRHVITCGADPISQRPVITDDESQLQKSKNLKSRGQTRKLAFSGTTVRLEWKARDDGTWPFDGVGVSEHYRFPGLFHHLVHGFSLFNPHATITLNWFGTRTTWKATDPAWRKWKPSDPTSPHWYEAHHLERLIGAYITHDRDRGADRLVSDFVAEFDGLTGSAKRTKVLEAAGCKRAKLSEFVIDNRLDEKRIGKLLTAMQSNTRPVNPQRLGFIGEDHLRKRLLAMGCVPESFEYFRRLPRGTIACVTEFAFAWLGPDATDERKIFSGANWSAAIKNPFRSFGATGEGLEAELNKLHAGGGEPIIFVLHVADPRVEYTDRGKSALIIGGAA